MSRRTPLRTVSRSAFPKITAGRPGGKPPSVPSALATARSASRRAAPRCGRLPLLYGHRLTDPQQQEDPRNRD